LEKPKSPILQRNPKQNPPRKMPPQKRQQKNPLDNIPPEVHNGASDTISEALNTINRENKRKKFAFETSEDAVTWTVFNYLRQRRILCEPLKQAGIDWLSARDMEPTMLLWGVPVPVADQSGVNLSQRLVETLTQRGEDPQKYSEPDVILDFGDSGVVIIEVKYRSPNDMLAEESPKWDKYLHSCRAFADIDGVKKTGYYELARNWRIAWDLAGGSSMALINPGPDTLFKERGGCKTQRFSEGLNQNNTHKFMDMTWRRFFKGIADRALWFDRYLKERGLIV
jgi:hypothetical protein